MQTSLDLNVAPEKYDVILADPPWQYDHSFSKSRRVENQYDTLTLDQIKGINVPDIAHTGTALFLWATAPKLVEAMETMKAWGFAYVSQYVWYKEIQGNGRWTFGAHEPLLIGRRPNTRAPKLGTQAPSVIVRRRTSKHSEKPDRVHEIIENMFPEAHMVELFARRPRAGWDVWGDDVDPNIELIVPPGPEDAQGTLDI